MIINDIQVINKDYSVIPYTLLAKHLNLDDDLIDIQYLEYLIESAVDWVEGRINKDIASTTSKLVIYDFSGNRIDIERGGFSGLTSITIDSQIVDNYRVINTPFKTIIELIDNKLFGDLELIYTSGGQSVKNFKHACLIKASDLYDTDRSDYSNSLNNNNIVMRLLNLM